MDHLMSMHLVVVCDSAPVDDAALRLTAMLRALHREHHTVSVVVGSGSVSEDVRALACDIMQVPMSTSMTVSGVLAAAEDLAQICTQRAADALHLFSGISILVGAIAAVRANVRFVVALDPSVWATDIHQPALALVLKQAAIAAGRVFCSPGGAGGVLDANPEAACRPFPSEIPVNQDATSDVWRGYLAELLALRAETINLHGAAWLVRTLEQHPNTPITSDRLVHRLWFALQAEARAATHQAAHASRSRDYELIRLESVHRRQRERLDGTAQALSELQRELGALRDRNDRLLAEIAVVEQRLTVAQVSVHERDRQLTEIRASTGWALLLILWRLRTILVPHGSRRDRTLWAVLCAYRAMRRKGPAGLLWAGLRSGARTLVVSQVADRVLDAAPAPLRNWVDGRLWPANAVRLAGSIPLSASEFLASWSEQPVLTVAAQPQPGAYDIIVFPIIDWSFRFQRPQQLASQFAEQGHRVFYVATTFCDVQSPIFRPLRQGVVEVQLPGPQGVSAYRDDLGETTERLELAIAQVRAQFSIANAVCIVNLPFWSPLVLKLRERFGWQVVYDCLDDYSGFTNTSRRMLRTEEQLTRSSDLVVVTSRHLRDKRSSVNPNCTLVPNAADFQHFRFGASSNPVEIARLRPGSPIVGYYGAISDWFDSSLVAALGRARPNCEFVLIGSTFGCDLRPLRGLPNVHLLGEKPYADLPPYLHAFDVGIIPFRRLPLTEATNPVKLFEYASAGKRIVATDLAELRHYSDYVTLVCDRQGWLDALDAALAPMQPDEIKRQLDFARTNTWRDRIVQLKNALKSLYPRVSIVVVTYNNIDYTRLCLESLYRTIYPSIQVIVVDNASTDGTPEFLQSFAGTHHDCTVLLNAVNYGFAKANNQGIAAAEGEYVVLLNNDTVVPPPWLSRLLYYLRDEHVGMVGPVTNWSGNESKIEVSYSTIGAMEEFAQSYTRMHAGHAFEIRMLAFFCVALRKSTIDEVGLLDERFGIGMFEDDDYARRLRGRGYTILCAEDVFVHHWGRASFSRLDEEYFRRLFEENRRKYEEKWGERWEPHQARAFTCAAPSPVSLAIHT